MPEDVAFNFKRGLLWDRVLAMLVLVLGPFTVVLLNATNS